MPTLDINFNLFLPRFLLKEDSIFLHFMKMQLRILKFKRERSLHEGQCCFPDHKADFQFCVSSKYPAFLKSSSVFCWLAGIEASVYVSTGASEWCMPIDCNDIRSYR